MRQSANLDLDLPMQLPGIKVQERAGTVLGASAACSSSASMVRAGSIPVT